MRHVLRPVLAGPIGLALVASAVSGCSTGSDESLGKCVDDIGWSHAAAHEGESGVFSGEVQSVRAEPNEQGSPTFLNIGADYPDPDRLSVLVWGKDVGSFGDLSELDGRDVCVKGTIQLFDGVAQIVVDDETVIYDVESTYDDAPGGPGW